MIHARPPTQYYLGYVYACSLPLKAPPYLRTGKQFSGRTLSREKYPFTGDLGNTHAVPPTPEWGAGDSRHKIHDLKGINENTLSVIMLTYLLSFCQQNIAISNGHFSKMDRDLSKRRFNSIHSTGIRSDRSNETH